MWQRILPYFEQYDCYVFDLPGHSSAKSMQWISIEEISEQIIEIVGQPEDDENYHIVGHSIGAAIGLSLMAYNPDSFASANLMSIVMGQDKESEPAVRWITNFVKPFTSMSWVQNLMMNGAGVPRSDFKYVRSQLNDCDADAIIDIFITNMFRHYPARLYGNETRSLILTVKGDDSEFLAYTKKLETYLPHSKHLILNDQKEFWFWNKPELFAQTILACIQNTPLPKI